MKEPQIGLLTKLMGEDWAEAEGQLGVSSITAISTPCKQHLRAVSGSLW